VPTVQTTNWPQRFRSECHILAVMFHCTTGATAQLKPALRARFNIRDRTFIYRSIDRVYPLTLIWGTRNPRFQPIPVVISTCTLLLNCQLQFAQIGGNYHENQLKAKLIFPSPVSVSERDNFPLRCRVFASYA